jgi:hypothetical protein
MESRTGDYEMTFAYIHRKYRGVASRHFDDECGSWNQKDEYVIVPTRAAFVHGLWTVTAFKGSDLERTFGGTCLTAQERDTLKGIRAGTT